MDESFLSRILSKMALAIIVVAVADLLFLNYLVIRNQRPVTSLPTRQDDQKPEERKLEVITASPGNLNSPSPSVEPKTEIKTVETKTVVERETQTIVQTAQKEIFIPIGSGSTNSNSYVELAGLEVSIDTNKYSSIESVVFEGSIWVQGGNGKMYTQLYNITDKHPVWNSDISTSSPTAVLSISSKINLDAGLKTYRVQAKTNLTEFAAHVENSRIKITLK